MAVLARTTADEHDAQVQGAQAQGAEVAGRAAKSSAAFRTISEVADDLDVAQHVLRFWESKFPQVRPHRVPRRQPGARRSTRVRSRSFNQSSGRRRTFRCPTTRLTSS